MIRRFLLAAGVATVVAGPLAAQANERDMRELTRAEIETAKNHTPPAAWENLVVTGRARSAIRRAARDAVRRQYSELGRRLIASHFERLGEEFTGGELYFGGIRCAVHQETQPRPGEEFTVTHAPGFAILHRGKHRHAAQKITSGRRMNLILWCMSGEFKSSYDEGQCPSWCDWQADEVISS